MSGNVNVYVGPVPNAWAVVPVTPISPDVPLKEKLTLPCTAVPLADP